VHTERSSDLVGNVTLVVRPHLLQAQHVCVDLAHCVDDRRQALFERPEPPPQIPRHHTHRWRQLRHRHIMSHASG
jgi:hypothetical protein